MVPGITMSFYAGHSVADSLGADFLGGDAGGDALDFDAAFGAAFGAGIVEVPGADCGLGKAAGERVFAAERAGC